MDITTTVNELVAENEARRAARKPRREPKAYTPSLLDRAIEVLAETGAELNTVTIWKAVAKLGLWSAPKGGKTPERTLYASFLAELERPEARVERGTAKGTFKATEYAAATVDRIAAYYEANRAADEAKA